MNIGMVVPYEDMGEFGVRIGQEIGIHVSYIVGESSNGVARARELIARDHVEAIVARNPVHHFLRRELDIPVISLDISSMDLLRAIRKIDPGKRVGFFRVDEDSEMYATVRLHEGVPCGEADARRQDLLHLRGHERDQQDRVQPPADGQGHRQPLRYHVISIPSLLLQ